MKARKKTRNCIEPWRSLQFEAGGNIIPCCSGTIEGDFGNINRDYFEAQKHHRSTDLFANECYRRLRKSLLSGELLKSCIDCRSVHDEDVTPDDLRQRVINHLESQGVETDGVDLTEKYAFVECGGNITNRCNFSCIYCAHSGKDGHTGHFRTEMNRECFLELIDLLYRNGLKIFNFCGIGELTFYTGWDDLCKIILDRYNNLRLRVISNFGRKLTDSELDTMSRLDMIHISCDTLEPDTYSWLRKGGNIDVLIDNILRLKTKLRCNSDTSPKIVFNVTATNIIYDKLEGLFRFAADNDMFVHLSSLFDMHGSVASHTKCIHRIDDMKSSHLPHIREILSDMPRRMKARNPISGVWEYRFLYKRIVERAERITYNQFVPTTEESVYCSFYTKYPRNPAARLRKIWTSFDHAHKGIYIDAGSIIKLDLPFISGRMTYRFVWCLDRFDGNMDIVPGPVETATVADELMVSAVHCRENYDHILFEVLSYDFVDDERERKSELNPVPPDGATSPVLIREAFLADVEESMALRLFESQEPIVIWCAGLRTLQILSSTTLGKANIRMIVDGDPKRKGQLFCGRRIHSPEDLGAFSGKIIVIHASSPEMVELQIRKLGITNEIIIL